MFLAMEYVPGRTLRDVLTAEGPLTPRAALDLFDPILQAIAAAHDAGLIHRDVKPENVILREDGQVKVADFGLARAVTAATTTNASGTLLGTVAYLSPEQVERGIADARSDVYATGLVLYEMLTGRKAFDGDSPIHVAYQHVHGTVPMPSQTVRTVPEELDQLVALATARDPDKRPANAGDYLAEVRRSRALMTTTELDLPADPERARRGRGRPDPAGWRRRADVRRPARVAHRPGSRTPRIPLRAHRPETARRRRRVWPAVLAVLLVLGLAGGGAAWWFTGGPGSMTRVPSLDRLTQAAAQAELQRADLRSSVTEVFDESAPAGTVMTREPGGRRRGPQALQRRPHREQGPGAVCRTRARRDARGRRLGHAHRAAPRARGAQGGVQRDRRGRHRHRAGPRRRDVAQARGRRGGHREQGPAADPRHRLHRQVRRPGQEGAHRRRADGQGRRPGQQRHGPLWGRWSRRPRRTATCSRATR